MRTVLHEHLGGSGKLHLEWEALELGIKQLRRGKCILSRGLGEWRRTESRKVIGSDLYL